MPDLLNQPTYPREEKPSEPKKPIEDQLKDAKIALNKANDAINGAKDTITNQTPVQQQFQTLFNVLEQALKDVDQTTGTYGKSLAELKKAIEGLAGYQDTKKRMLEGVLDEKQRKAIDDLIKTHDQWIGDQKTKVGKAIEAVAAGRGHLAKALESQVAAQKTFDELKAYLTTVQSRITLLKTFQTDVEKLEDNQQDLKRKHKMYLLILLMKEPLAVPPLLDLKTEEQLKTSLDDAWTALNDAKTNAQAMKAALEKAEAELKKESEELTRRQANRTKDLLHKAETYGSPKAP